MSREWILKFVFFVFLIISNLVLLFVGLPDLNFKITGCVLAISLILFFLGRIKELRSWDLYISYILNLVAICFNLYVLF